MPASAPNACGKAGERPALALKKYGVEYLEVRLFDLNPFVDVGIAPEQASFADILLLMCLFRQSPPITAREQGENDENLARIVNRGRQPGLNLLVHNRKQAFRPIAHALFDDMQPFAQMLDAAYAGNHYSTTLASLRTRIDHPESTPSAQVLAAAREHKGYFKYAMQQSQKAPPELARPAARRGYIWPSSRTACKPRWPSNSDWRRCRRAGLRTTWRLTTHEVRAHRKCPGRRIGRSLR
jgi:gamma-glutamylcysteine synthetase